MSQKKSSVVAVVALVALALSGGSATAATVAPPGSSGVDQYVEVIPSAGGSVPTPKGGSKSGGSALSPKTARRLSAQGSDGQALSAIVDSTAPPGAREVRGGRHSSREGAGGIGRTRSTASGSGSNAAPAIPQAASSLGLGSDVDGMGLLLPALLIGTAVVVGVLFLTRRRRAQ